MTSMHKGIATVSLSGVLEDKLRVIADAGFDGVEIFDNDLIACPLAPKKVAALCDELGLSVDLFQPVRDVEGVAESEFAHVLRRLERKFEIANELGAPVVLACSNVREDAVDDPGLRASQLHRIGELAAEHGLRVAYEALAWGRHVSRVGQAWDAVARADHPAITLAVDTFHMLSRGDDGTALGGIPGARIGFLQVADAPLLDLNVLEWSRHFRSFPGQGVLDVAGVVAATLATGYAGPVSLEVFSDVVRQVPPQVTARDALRSLVFLEDQLSRGLPRVEVQSPAFVELASAPGDPAPTTLLAGLGFTSTGQHRSKPVTRWQHGGADVLVNQVRTSGPACPEALGLVVSSASSVQDRARALDWPSVTPDRGDGDARLPGILSPSGTQVFFSEPAGSADDWRRDFGEATGAPLDDGWLGLDHVGITVEADRLDEEVSFYRALLGFAPGRTQEFIQPHGRMRSLALRPPGGGPRIVLNVSETGTRGRGRTGMTQLAYGCTDLLAQVRGLRERGVSLMAVPDNYYADLDARFGLAPALLARLHELGVLYDADESGGELFHVYTPTYKPGYFIELLERRGGYDGYGAANTHVRLAAHPRG